MIVMIHGMPFAYFERLSPARKKIYLRSDAITRVELPPGPPLEALLHEMQIGLVRENRSEVERPSQGLLDALTHRLAVPRVRVRVLSVRPSGDWGELHGLYEPFEDGTPPLITLWMRTVARRQVVAFKSFLRTLLHELCHHLDYELYRLPETFHTQGFYQRESSLYYQIRGEPEPGAEPIPATPRRSRTVAQASPAADPLASTGASGTRKPAPASNRATRRSTG